MAKYKGQEEIYNCIHTFEKVAIEVMKERKGIEVCANVDYYSGYVYSLLGIEMNCLRHYLQLVVQLDGLAII